MDKLHNPLVAACKVVAADNRNVLQPQSQGCSFIEDVRSKADLRAEWSARTPVLAREAKLSKAFGTTG